MQKQDRYYIQILNGSADDLLEHVWDIQLQYPEDEIIQVIWNNTGWPNLMTSCQLQDAFGGTFVDINMVTGEGLQILLLQVGMDPPYLFLVVQ